MRVVAYIRCSTDTQDDSHDTQLSVIGQYCAKHGHELVRTYREDNISGGSTADKRSQLPRLLAEIQDKRRDFQGVIVVHVDRVFRSLELYAAFQAKLQKHRCELLAINSPVDWTNPVGRAMSSIMAVFAQLERETTGQRIRDHNLSLLAKGEYPGGRLPLGLHWNPETRIVETTIRAEDVTAIFSEWVRQNGNSHKTAAVLNRLGILSARGSLWSASSVRDVVASPAYRQEFCCSGERRQSDAIPRIVDASLTQQVDTILATRTTFTPRQTGSQWAYSGLLSCGQCGKVMIAMASRSRSHPEIVYGGWICRGTAQHRVCESRRVAEKYIDRMMGNALQDTFTRYADALAGKVHYTKPRPPNTKRLDRLGAMKTRVLELYIDGLISREDRDKRMQDIDAQVASLGDRPKAQAGLNPEEIHTLIAEIAETWPNMPQDVRRSLLLRIGAKGIVGTERGKPLWLLFSCRLPGTQPLEYRLR